MSNTTQYLYEIYNQLEKVRAAKEVVCSITTGFRLVPSIRTSPGLNPYHASVANIGYGTDAVQGFIQRFRNGERLLDHQLVFEIDTLKISAAQIFPNFQLAMENSTPPTEAYPLIQQSYQLNKRIVDTINHVHDLGKQLYGNRWYKIIQVVENVQAIPRL
jgi:hypothetical protein